MPLATPWEGLWVITSPHPLPPEMRRHDPLGQVHGRGKGRGDGVEKVERRPVRHHHKIHDHLLGHPIHQLGPDADLGGRQHLSGGEFLHQPDRIPVEAGGDVFQRLAERHAANWGLEKLGEKLRTLPSFTYKIGECP